MKKILYIFAIAMTANLFGQGLVRNGAVSPKFTNYENYKGGITSLEDLKGKYVYIDVWATWCGPCRGEIPYLKRWEKKYHGKNVHFVSISIDHNKEEWKEMVASKKLGGIQLFAPKGVKDRFMLDYKINAIPRFILIDPDGKIVDVDAPRPSDPALIGVFKKLNI